MTSPAAFSRAELREQGLSDGQITGLHSSGRLVRVHRSWYLPTPPTLDDELRAVQRAQQREVVVSHLSAARLRGLPRPLGGWRRPELTAASGSPRSRPDLRIAVAPLPAHHVGRHRGIAVTSAARTVVDCARTLPGPDGLAIADAALRRGLCPRSDLEAVLATQSGWPGVRTASAVCRLADGRRESPLESWSCWGFHSNGLSCQWQVNVWNCAGAFLGRCDSWWAGVAGEADGRGKYPLMAAERSGTDAERVFQVLDRERAREKGFRDAKVEVIRWGAGDVRVAARTGALVAHIRRTVAEAAGSGRFRGRAAAA